MKINEIVLHNFRSIKDAAFNLSDYSLLVGSNNSGKSNVLAALRIFYEDDIKFSEKIDFPKFTTDDQESWIEIGYTLTEDEYSNIKDAYKRPDRSIRVRKYLKADGDKVQANQSNIYGYEGNVLSSNLFYGAKNISSAKLGSLIFIPEVITTDDTLKMTGPSPLRNIITFVMKKVVKTSSSFSNLSVSFEQFNSQFREEYSKDGFSLHQVVSDINDELKDWEIEFQLNINAISPEDIIKNLVTHATVDHNLGKEIAIKNMGQGLQRHLIYTLLKLSAKYVDTKTPAKKEFSPDFNLIAFEEPEAFLHPSQQEYLNSSLRKLSETEGQQIIVSTHSPIFVSHSIEDITNIIKLRRRQGITRVYQITKSVRDNILNANHEFSLLLKNKLKDTSLNSETINRIKKELGDTDDNTKMEEESLRYALWLDSERCSAFFADIVLICEGASEKTFICYMLRNKWTDLKEKRICVLDSMGKYNIHRYMNLFEHLGIYHSCLYDGDGISEFHGIVNNFIESQKNAFTKSIDHFEVDIEEFCSIPACPYPSKKPLHLLWHYAAGKIGQTKIDLLRRKIDTLVT